MALKSMSAAAAPLLAALLLAGCETGPIVVQSPPPVAIHNPGAPAPAGRVGHDVKPGRVCKVAIGEIRDLRGDTQVGVMGWRPTTFSDIGGWVRTGLTDGIGLSHSVVLVPADQPADVELKVEILRTYIESVNSAKAATVVLRIRYGGPHAPAEPRVYRGIRTAMNWAATADETQGALRLALDDAVGSVRGDVGGLCWGVIAPPEKP